ncbi:ATP-binding protein [Terasakiella sp. A23]|uniref:sensor histidine kinase n=1 Tax=Terasakiella sp. FCG-A23 TaxID=3080561 RepID=UPI00295386C6|nr:ATP-binding protein [Terasakiella sp. A23]MDV7338621.1 ATP-binding protein [Terasakiella sp. A23]
MRLNRSLLIAIFVFVGIFLVWRITIYSETNALNDLRFSGHSRAELYATTLRKELDTYRSMPYILARDQRVKALIEGKGDPFVVNQHLEDYANNSKASALYVLSGDGTALASSNWRSDQSFVGHNYSYRPYFQDALKGQNGNYYAVGVQTRFPGYYISYPVFREGTLLGVVVAKVDLSKLEKTWTELGENVAVSDAFGVFILSSIPDWRYRTMRELSPNTRKRLQTIQYLDQPLNVAPMKRKATELGTQVEFKQTAFLEQSIQLPDLSWRLHYLSDLKPMQQTVHQDTLLAAASWVVVAFILLFLRERRQKIRSRREAKDAQRIREANEQLEAEIHVRRETEKNLREAQSELIQAEKLAALGRMSAAIAHELNQPIAAIRTFSASAQKFLERAAHDEVDKNLTMVSQLTERMAAITSQLKTFARKSPENLSQIDLKETLERVIGYLKPALDQEKVDLDINLEAVEILADQVRLEQVFTNLIRNAADAVKDHENKQVSVTITQTDTTTEIDIADNGEGIDEEHLNKIFDPFFTTKEVGDGLGLGLYISYGIISDLGGQLKVRNRKDHGACFTIQFPKGSKP